jgi:hypothetical protein
LKEGHDLHDTWVGAEPLSTQIATEEAFSKTRYNKDLRISKVSDSKPLPLNAVFSAGNVEASVRIDRNQRLRGQPNLYWLLGDAT